MWIRDNSSNLQKALSNAAGMFGIKETNTTNPIHRLKNFGKYGVVYHNKSCEHENNFSVIDIPSRLNVTCIWYCLVILMSGSKNVQQVVGFKSMELCLRRKTHCCHENQCLQNFAKHTQVNFSILTSTGCKFYYDSILNSNFR